MDVAIVGAAGSIGRQIATELVAQRVLGSAGRLVLVGHRGGASERTLPGIAADLMDAFVEEAPELDLAFAPKDVVADIVVLAAGATIERAGEGGRAELLRKNVPMVEAYAKAIARHGHGEELLFVLTNPVEPCVAAACRHLDRRRVIGMGGYLDTLRFRREIAASLGVSRERVQGLVLGEHGLGMVPCFSTVSVHGFDHREGKARIAAFSQARETSAKIAISRLSQLLQTRGTRAAYAYVDKLGPRLRTLVKPYVTQLSGARTPAGSAEMIVRLIRTLLSGGQVLTAAQVQLAGEFLGLHGVVGAPVVMTLRGVDRIVPYDLSASETQAVRASVYVDPKPARKSARLRNSGESEPRHLACVVVCDSSARPGIAERVSAVFAERGINLESLRTEKLPSPRITLEFVATLPVQAYVARRLTRMAGVRSVRLSALSRGERGAR